MSGPAEENDATDRRLRCPACRAGQPLQPRCRRCGADLSLLVRAVARAQHLLAQRNAARQAGDTLRIERIEQELALLAPRYLSP